MILGGVETPHEPVMRNTKISITREKQTRGYVPEDALAFSKEDFETSSQPHNGALVSSFLVNSFRIKHVLVDPGSSPNITRSRVIEQLRLLDQIILATRVLNGFNMAIETMKGEIILPVSVAGTTQNVKIHVFEGDMKYNTLFGRPRIHCMGVTPSTFHLMMKFPTEDGVKTIIAEQHAAREVFAVRNIVPVPISLLSKEPKDNQTASLAKPD